MVPLEGDRAGAGPETSGTVALPAGNSPTTLRPPDLEFGKGWSGLSPFDPCTREPPRGYLSGPKGQLSVGPKCCWKDRVGAGTWGDFAAQRVGVRFGLLAAVGCEWVSG